MTKHLAASLQLCQLLTAATTKDQIVVTFLSSVLRSLHLNQVVVNAIIQCRMQCVCVFPAIIQQSVIAAECYINTTMLQPAAQCT